ncbi:hypothetical protein LTR28_011247, partial [Elasticomyces elasticus]
MFYSEVLLSKTGPLGRVWLAANMEKKLSKAQILQKSVEKEVQDIVDTGQAPLALRLSGHLLLGVVRIYSRKARYLLDDCNEALMKIKMAFRPGIVDLPPSQSHAANPAALLVPDTITELDLLAPIPDLEDLLAEPTTSRYAPGQDPTLLDYGMSQSQLNPSSDKDARPEAEERLELYQDDLPLDLGFGDDTTITAAGDRSIEVGRRQPTPRPGAEDVSGFLGEDLGLDFGDDLTSERRESRQPPAAADYGLAGETDVQMGGMEELDLGVRDDLSALIQGDDRQRRRETLSPLSSIRSSVERDLEQTFQLDVQTGLEARADDDTVVQAQQRVVKRRRVLQADAETELRSALIRAQQEDRSKITKPPSFLPRDPVLLALINMQRSGGFVSNVLGDGRSLGWAPELRGILSMEVVRGSGELKRKRDS